MGATDVNRVLEREGHFDIWYLIGCWSLGLELGPERDTKLSPGVGGIDRGKPGVDSR